MPALPPKADIERLVAGQLQIWKNLKIAIWLLIGYRFANLADALV